MDSRTRGGCGISPPGTGKGNGRRLAGQRGCLGTQMETEGFLVPQDHDVILSFSKRAWTGCAEKGGVPNSWLRVDTARVRPYSPGRPAHRAWGMGRGARSRSPDEAPAGDDLGVAVIDGLTLQAQRVALYTAVPWEGKRA